MPTHIFIYSYTTTFDNGVNRKMKAFSTLENAKKFGTEYHKTGYRILHYTIEVLELDFKPENNNAYKDKEIVT